MSDTTKDGSATYEEVAELERQFQDVEQEIIRQQYALTKPLYEKRAKLVAKIPDFWELVMEQAPPEVDQYVQPTDSALLLSSLSSVYVSRPEIDQDSAKGDPRSLTLRLEFRENEYFEDKVLEKKFWFRRARDGNVKMVSEPVPIKWKPGKDLTQGLLDLAVRVWEADKKQGRLEGTGKPKKKAPKREDYTADQKALREKIGTFGLGGVSFFCWFGFRGEDISPEENAIANEEDKQRRADFAAGKNSESKEEDEEEQDDDDEDEEAYPRVLEIFPDGPELTIAFCEDLWPFAHKYFTQAHEVAAMSDFDFEEDRDMEDEDEEEPEEYDDDDDEAPPLKRVKAN
ncbi:nucleosome assembly protein [Xylaria sp. CBS 124048]|nr:nucleosome assembly protein [Xylaria sp. CBS 124048]